MEKTEVSNLSYLKDAPIRKAIAHLSIPMIIGMSVGTFYNIMNAFFIGLVNDTAMFSAITLGLPIFTVLMAIGNMLGVGGGTFITRLLAKGDMKGSARIAGYTFYSCIGISAIIAILALLFTTPLVELLGADALTFDYTKTYMLMLLVGGITVIWNFALEQLVRAEGASKESMYGMFISIAVSLILDVLFILVLNWHVFGAALAMILANLASTLYYVYFLHFKSESMRGFLVPHTISIKDQLEIYKIGVSELLQASFLIVTALLLNNFSMGYGEHVVASFGIALRLSQIPEFVTMGIYLGLIPLIAYNVSSVNLNRLKEVYRYSAWLIGIIAGGFTLLVYLFKDTVIGWFSNDPNVQQVGTSILIAMLVSAIFNGFAGWFGGIFKAAGEAIPANIMAICQGGLFAPVIIIMHKWWGLSGLIWSTTITEVIACGVGVVLFVIHYRKLMSRAKIQPSVI
jgi:putative MATE family efflux protein